jgi:hypothetical protein
LDIKKNNKKSDLFMMKNRKAVSEIIATTVLLLITSILGVTLYTISFSSATENTILLRDEYNSGENIAKERFFVIDAFIDIINPKEIKLEVLIMNYGEIDVSIDAIYVNGTPHYYRDVDANLDNFLVDIVEGKSWYTENYRSSTLIYVSDIKKFYDFHHILDKEIQYQIGARPEMKLQIVAVSERGVRYESIFKIQFEG